MPALPKDVETDSLLSGVSAQEGARSKGNSLGMSTTTLRLASQTLGTGDGPSWFGAAKMGNPSNVRRTDPAMASPPSSPPQVPLDQSPVEGARPSSRTSSINFSYPTRARVGSPTASPVESRFPVDTLPGAEGVQQHPRTEGRQQHNPQMSKRHLSESAASSSRRRTASSSADQTLVYDPNSRRMVRRADLLAVEQAVLSASEKPVKTRRKRQTSQNAGSHLAQGTMGRTKSIGSKTDRKSDSDASRPQPQLQAQAKSSRDLQEDIEEPAVKAIIASPRIEAQRVEQQRARNTAAPPTVSEAIEPVSPSSPRITVRRQPSIVKEESEPEPEDREPARAMQKAVSEALDSVPTRQRLHESDRTEALPDAKEQTRGQPLHTHGADTWTRSRDQGATPMVSKPQEPPTTELGATSSSAALRERTHSISPPRQAHFGPVHNNLRVMHSPPPRSISPRKSALKHSSPSRGASPSDEASDFSLNANMREEQPVARKKSVRVSFDDGNAVVVGESASTNESSSPVISSPQNQNRRPWYSSIGRPKQDLALLDDDEVMKPRPALPSFGSIRDKKPREISAVEVERPLVRPVPETAYSPPSTGSPSLAPSIGSTIAEDSRTEFGTLSLGQSNDHAVGAILGREFEERLKNPANISRFREPLPPVVTSVEGNGYLSESSSSSAFEEFQEFQEARPTSTSAGPQNAMALASTALGGSNSNSAEETKDQGVIREINIPSISISQPSPRLPDTKDKSSHRYFVDIPGGFPDDDSDLSLPSAATPPVAEAVSTSTSNYTSQLRSVEPPSDSESSIYSDAYEDLSDIEGDGFMSLNAVLESPSPPAVHVQVVPAAKENTTAKEVQQVTPKLDPELSTATTVVDSHPTDAGQDDWEKAKAFWRTLTVDKRAQLEKEALEDAGIDGDLEEVKPAPKAKKKKSIERRNSERKALAVHLAQQMVVQQQTSQPSNPERNYMIKPGTKWADCDGDDTATAPTMAMRTTLRGESRQQSTSARGGDVPRFRKSMRSDAATQNSNASQPRARAVVSKQGRAASLPTPVPVPQPQLTSTGHRQKASGFSPIKRRGSTDSESSFKRSKPAGSGHQGFSFRKSMRQASPTPEPSATRQGKRFSLRSLSPTGSTPPPGRAHPPTSLAANTNTPMRRTLRDSSDERKSPSKVHMPTFGLSGGKKNSGKRASKSKFSSRFGNSSDEDEGGGASGFRSRFEDSSDDDVIAPIPLPVPLPRPSASAAALTTPAPASSTPAARHLRNQNSIASTALPEELEESEELPDSSDNSKQQVMAMDGDVTATGTAPLAPTRPRTSSGLEADIRRSRSGRGGLIVTTSPIIGNTGVVPVALNTGRPGSSASKRSSFMSVLKRKKNTGSSLSGAGDKISRGGIAESAARRDTKLERSVGQLRGIRGNNDVVEEPDEGDEDEQEAQPQSPQSPPRSPKLQKRIFAISRSTGTGVGTEAGGDFDPEKEGFGIGVGTIRRPATSGNLGTRTLSGVSVSVAPPQPGFLQNRTASTGVLSLDGIGSAAGTPKKKKFGTLRRMFGLHD